jgi:hypothetical protein
MKRTSPMALPVAILGLLGLVGFTTGCESVPAWKRQQLAHPTMSAEEMSMGLDGHVRAVSEGATGGLAGGGGGCGCN